MPETITWNHSRLASAHRIAQVSSNFTYDQMKTILQIEYAALPNEDKKATASFFSLRYRTLERALENVFEKENIVPIVADNTIKSQPNLSLALDILQWIGEQERSFYYKTSKNRELFFCLQVLGKTAHKMITCNNLENLDPLKDSAKRELNKISSLVDVTPLHKKVDTWKGSMRHKQ